MKKHRGIVAWNFKPRKGRTAAELDEWYALDAEERQLRAAGMSYLINCCVYTRGAAVFGATTPAPDTGLTALAVGLKGYIIVPKERYAEFPFATTGELFRAIIKRLLNLCKLT